MLVRCLPVLGPGALRDRIARLLGQDDLLLLQPQEPEQFWSNPRQEACDLVLVTQSELPEPVAASIAAVRALPERPELIVLTRSDDPSSLAALQAAGAFAVLSPKLADDQLGQALTALVDRHREAVLHRLRAEPRRERVDLDELPSHNPAMQRLLKLAARVAASNSSLLILGETGSGKEWLARAVHAKGPRSKAPFVGINCSAVPENLLESELFGHEKGAFTGAIRSRRGYFELAHRGTLFLDEIAEMPPHLQVKLLRVLQERKIYRIGSERAIEIDVRIIAATNRDLVEAMAVKDFRQDLYYRLAVVTLSLPPLRQRPEDIPELVEALIARLGPEQGRHEISGISPQALAALKRYEWPGNVRELINVIERAVLLCEGNQVSLTDLPEEIVVPAGAPAAQGPCASPPGAVSFDRFLELPVDKGRQELVAAFEREYFSSLLGKTKGNIRETAERAGVDPRTLYNKLKLYRLRKEDFKEGSPQPGR